MHEPVVLATHEWPAEGADGWAPTVVLVHGVTGWWRTWWRVGPALASAGWHVVAVDLRGHGDSPRIDGHATVGQLAADVGAFIEGMGGHVEALIGHSLGAAVAAELAFVRPELVGRLVLEDPPSVVRAGDIDWQENLERELLAAGDDPEGEVARELAANPSWLEEDARQDVEGKQLADRPGLMASFQRHTGARVLEVAPTLKPPTLYVLAAEDRSVLWGAARRQLESTLQPHSRIHVADSGHTVHRDCFDDYLRLILEWLRR